MTVLERRPVFEAAAASGAAAIIGVITAREILKHRSPNRIKHPQIIIDFESAGSGDGGFDVAREGRELSLQPRPITNTVFTAIPYTRL